MPRTFGSDQPPARMINVLCNSYFPRRGYQLIGDKPSDATINADIDDFGYTKIEATCTPRGERTRAIFVVLASGSDASNKISALRTLLNGIESPSRIHTLNEVNLIVDSTFFSRKGLSGIISEKHDKDGPAYRVFPYRIFIIAHPEHIMSAEHRVLPEDEKDALLSFYRREGTDLKDIPSTDPNVIWIGAQPGDIIEIIDRSQDNGHSVDYRRMERREWTR